MKFTLDADDYKKGNAWEKTQGLCNVVVHRAEKDFTYGDNLVLCGSLKSPPKPANPGEFDYSAYLKQRKIYAVFEVDSDTDTAILKIKEKPRPLGLLKAKIFTLRERINRHIHRYLPRREAVFLSAMMLGLRSELPLETKDIFIKTGTAHILAISGLHLAIIVYILFFVLGLLHIRYNLGAFLVIIVVLCYVILCGGRMPVMRAGIMITVFLMGRILNRDIDVYNILSLAGILILLGNPMQLFSAGFILSFVCVFSIVYLSPKIEKLFMQERFNKKILCLIKPLSVSLAVYTGVAPIIAYHFNIISPITIIANLFIVPLTGLLICAGSSFIVFGLLSSFLASLFGAAAWLVALLLEKSVFYLSKIPYSYFYIHDLPLWSVAGYYVLIILAINRKRFRLSKGAVCMIILACINFCIWLPLL